MKPIIVGGLIRYDGNKKVKGLKRNIAIDTQENLRDPIVHCANQHETQTLELLVQELKERQIRIIKIIADAGYRVEIIEVIKLKIKLHFYR